MITEIDVDIAHVDAPDRTERVRLLVDSGATHSVVPAPILERLGIRPHAEQVYRLANGDQVRRRRGRALFMYQGHSGTTDVVFGEPGDAQLLGVFTLEALGFGLDPLRRQLIELPMMLT